MRFFHFGDIRATPGSIMFPARAIAAIRLSEVQACEGAHRKGEGRFAGGKFVLTIANARRGSRFSSLLPRVYPSDAGCNSGHGRSWHRAQQRVSGFVVDLRIRPIVERVRHQGGDTRAPSVP